MRREARRRGTGGAGEPDEYHNERGWDMRRWRVREEEAAHAAREARVAEEQTCVAGVVLEEQRQADVQVLGAQSVQRRRVGHGTRRYSAHTA